MRSSRFSAKGLLRFTAALAATAVFAGGGRADTTSVRTAPVIDTVLFDQKDAFKAVSPVTDPENFEKHMRQQPTVALFKSMALPGLGQWGNHSYIKAVFFAGLEVWFVGSALHYGRQASDFRRKWNAAGDVSTRNEFYGLYDDRRNSRNAFTWYAVINTFISMFDAYVDAHLSGFPARVKEKGVALKVVPVREGTAVALTYSF